MSNHHSQKSINLHHFQVNTGHARRQQFQVERMQRYLSKGNEARRDYAITLAFGFICFSYTIIASAVYLPYVMRV